MALKVMGFCAAPPKIDFPPNTTVTGVDEPGKTMLVVPAVESDVEPAGMNTGDGAAPVRYEKLYWKPVVLPEQGSVAGVKDIN